MEAKFLSRSSIYKGDYDCLFRTPQNEMKTELHYHDFYEIVPISAMQGFLQSTDRNIL